MCVCVFVHIYLYIAKSSSEQIVFRCGILIPKRFLAVLHCIALQDELDYLHQLFDALHNFICIRSVFASCFSNIYTLNGILDL